VWGPAGGPALNRLRPPADGDILVPGAGGAVFGMTDDPSPTPQAGAASAEEVARLRALAAQWLPWAPAAVPRRAYAGVRALAEERPGRASGRGYRIAEPGAGCWSLVGGKWTTCRAMAAALGDALGLGGPALSALTPLHPAR